MTLQGRAFILIYQMRKRKPINGLFPQEVAERHNLKPNNSDSNSALFYKPCCENGNVSESALTSMAAADQMWLVQLRH